MGDYEKHKLKCIHEYGLHPLGDIWLINILRERTTPVELFTIPCSTTGKYLSGNFFLHEFCEKLYDIILEEMSKKSYQELLNEIPKECPSFVCQKEKLYCKCLEKYYEFITNLKNEIYF